MDIYSHSIVQYAGIATYTTFHPVAILLRQPMSSHHQTGSRLHLLLNLQGHAEHLKTTPGPGSDEGEHLLTTTAQQACFAASAIFRPVAVLPTQLCTSFSSRPTFMDTRMASLFSNIRKTTHRNQCTASWHHLTQSRQEKSEKTIRQRHSICLV